MPDNPTDSEAPSSGASERGRGARTPASIPLKGWLDIVWRIKGKIRDDSLSIVAAGVAFYGFLASIPALGAVIALYAYIAEPGEVQAHIAGLSDVLPAEVVPLLQEQAMRMAEQENKAGWGALVALLFALWGSARGVKALIMGLNVAYGEPERRGFVKLNAFALLLTFGGVIGGLLLFVLVAIFPGVLQFVGLGAVATTLLQLIRWPFLLVVFLAGLAFIYRYGPCRSDAKWRWASPGALVSTALWAIGSVGFSLYVSYFGNYDKTYGALGAVVIFLMWLFVSAFVILIGAELNREMERQTREDTTTGDPEPIGERGAYAADTVGESLGETAP